MMYHKTKHEHRKHFCMHCLQCFSAEEVLSKHKTNCMVINGEQAIRLPRKGNNILQFQNYHKQMPAPFIMSANFEAISEKVSGCQPNSTKSYTGKYQKHIGCGYGYKVVCFYNDNYSKPKFTEGRILLKSLCHRSFQKYLTARKLQVPNLISLCRWLMWKNKSLRLLRCVIFVDVSIHGIRKQILESGIIAILLDSTGDRHIRTVI